MINKLLYILSRKEKYNLIRIFILILALSFIEAVSVGVMLPFTSLITGTEHIEDNRYLSLVYNLLNLSSLYQFILIAVLLVFMIFISKNILTVLVHYDKLYFVNFGRVEIGKRMLEDILRKDYLFFLLNSTPRFVNLIQNEVTRTVFLIQFGLELLVEIIVVLAIIVTMLLVEFYITMLLGVFALLFILATNRYTKRVLTMISREITRHSNSIISILIQTFHGIKEIKFLHTKDYFLAKFEDEGRKLARLYVTNNVIQLFPKVSIELLVLAGILVLILAFMSMGKEIKDLIPIMTVYVVAMYRIMPAMNKISTLLMGIRNYSNGVVELYNVLQEFGIGERAISQALSYSSNDGGSGEKVSFNDEIRLANVFFKYPGGAEWVLDDVNLRIEKGSHIAIIGSSGAGKTTLVDILLGLLAANQGEIFLDRSLITEGNLFAYRRLVGYVPQSVYILDGTLTNNIMFGRAHDVKLLDKAITLAELEEVVDDLPEKRDALLGEHGALLSGGQVQRVGIARALYGNPEIVILDEATSALDTVTEDKILSNLFTLKDETVIHITHRLSTIIRCDVIHLLQKGQVIASGTHEELNATCKEYVKLLEKGNII
jgi:ABC-type multidrug transport system fused ATPase/permease subunit